MSESNTSPNRMAHVTMRIPRDTLEYFRKFPNPSVEMREVLVAYAKERAGFS